MSEDLQKGAPVRHDRSDTVRGLGWTAVMFALLLMLPACRQPRTPPPKAPQNIAMPASVPMPSAPVENDPRMLRFHRVDMLIAQWDVAQAAARAEQAEALAGQIRGEVDAAFGDFVTASDGRMGTQLQYVGVGGLGFSARPEATQALLNRLADTDPQLVGNALIALKLRADPATPTAPLLKLLSSRATAPRRYAPLALANVVEAQWRAYGRVDPAMQRAAMQTLSGVVADRDPFVRLHVAKALGALRAPGSYDLLVILMRDDEVQIRLAAAAGLERLGDPNGFPETIRLLADVADDVKPMVRDILASFAHRLRGHPLTPNEIQRLGTSPHAWSNWFNEFTRARGLRLGE
jgi:hypothetical protein